MENNKYIHIYFNVLKILYRIILKVYDTTFIFVFKTTTWKY